MIYIAGFTEFLFIKTYQRTLLRKGSINSISTAPTQSHLATNFQMFFFFFFFFSHQISAASLFQMSLCSICWERKKNKGRKIHSRCQSPLNNNNNNIKRKKTHVEKCFLKNKGWSLRSGGTVLVLVCLFLSEGLSVKTQTNKKPNNNSKKNP